MITGTSFGNIQDFFQHLLTLEICCLNVAYFHSPVPSANASKTLQQEPQTISVPTGAWNCYRLTKHESDNPHTEF